MRGNCPRVVAPTVELLTKRPTGWADLENRNMHPNHKPKITCNYNLPRCTVSLSIDQSDEDFLVFTSSGIPDHNLCAAPPNSQVIEIDYSYRIPREPVLRTGDVSQFPATNMGEIGFALNG